MPSPFPGMDPYLEDPVLWPSIHQRLITYVGDKLTELLPPRYVANINERLTIDEPDRDIYPDASIFESSTPPGPTAATITSAAAVADPPWLIEVGPEEAREPFIQIVPAADVERVVTVLELLSPANKSAGARGREQYRAKQRQTLKTSTHLLEIDLLRRGEHTVAAPRESLVRRGPYHYLVSLSRGGRRSLGEVWGIPLNHRLPRISVPLLDGDADLVLDLQPLFDACYDKGGYVRRLDYRRDPIVHLLGDDAVWADALLRERGLRT